MGRGMLGYKNETKSRISRARRAIFKFRIKVCSPRNYLTNKKKNGDKTQSGAKMKARILGGGRGEGGQGSLVSN